MNEIIRCEKVIREFSSSLYSIESQIAYFNELFFECKDIPPQILFHYNNLFDLIQIVREIINTLQEQRFTGGIDKCVKEYSRRMEDAGFLYAIWGE